MNENALEHRRVQGNREYDKAIDTLLARPQRTLRIFDRHLGGGYNSVHRYDLLRDFLLRRGFPTLVVLRVVREMTGRPPEEADPPAEG